MARVLGVALVALVGAGCAVPAPSWMQNGMQAPELAGATVEGQPVALSRERGKVVTVFFFADWCPHCRSCYPAMRELAARARRGGSAIIGVDSDNTADEIRAAMRRENITFSILHDADGRNASAWGVTALPTVYVVDGNGTIREYGLTGDSLLTAVDALVAEPRGRP